MTQNVATLLDVKSRKSLSKNSLIKASIAIFRLVQRQACPKESVLPYNMHLLTLVLFLFLLDDIPNGLFRQMIACQTAANEFLRQFWSAIYPSPVDSQSILSIATPAQRAAKATKMIGYLSKTPEKVEALVRVAQQHGVSGSKVETVKKFFYFYLCIFVFCSFFA